MEKGNCSRCDDSASPANMEVYDCAICSPATATKRRRDPARQSVSEPPTKAPAVGDDKEPSTRPTSTATLHVPDQFFAYRRERRRSSGVDVPDLSAIRLSSGAPSGDDRRRRRTGLARSRSFELYDPVEECQWRIDTKAMIFASNPDLRADELCTMSHFRHLRTHRRNAVCYDFLEPLLPSAVTIRALKICGLT